MIKKLLYILPILFIIPTTAFASMFGEENAALSAQVALLTQISAEEKLRNTTLITDFLPRAIQAVKIANDTLAASRYAYRMVEAVKDYTTKDLLTDVQTGLGQAFPGIKELSTEISEMVDNSDKIKNGGFWAKRNQWDNKTAGLIESLTKGYEEKSLFPWLFPHASYLHGYKPSEPERIFIEAMRESGMENDIKLESIQRRAITHYAVEYDKQAEAQKNLTNEILAKELLTAGDMRAYLYDMATISKMDLATHEDSKAFWEQYNKEKAARIKAAKDKDESRLNGVFDINVKKK